MNKDKETKTTEEQSEEVKDVNQTSSDNPVRTINDHIAKVLNIKKQK
jgi:hypothetical protein